MGAFCAVIFALISAEVTAPIYAIAKKGFNKILMLNQVISALKIQISSTDNERNER